MSIRKRDRPLPYQVRVDLGPDPITGERRTLSQSFASEREARRWEAKTLVAVHEGRAASRSSETVRDLLNAWLLDKVRFHALKTREDYERTVRLHIYPYLGSVRAQSLTRKDVHRWVIGRLNAGAGTRTMEMALVHLRSALKLAVEMDTLAYNPAVGVRVPRAHNDKKEMTVWTEEEAQAFLKAAEDYMCYGPIFLVSLYTGMRKGELLGLRWRDINWKAGVLKVRQSIGPVHNKPVIKATKNPQSMRDVKVDDRVLDALQAHRVRQNEQRLFLGDAWANMDLVFTTSVGSPISGPNLWRVHKKIVERAGVPYIRIHDHRHTHVTMALEEGEDLKAVSRRVGHGNTRITAELYGHVTSRMQDSVVATIGRKLGGS